MRIIPNKMPIDCQSGVQLSRGTDHLETVEEALSVCGQRIASPDFAEHARQMIEVGTNLRYELIVKKSNSHGFVVTLNYIAEAPKKQLGTFLRLV